MNPDTAELTLPDSAGELAVPFESSPLRDAARALAGRWAGLRADDARMLAVRDSWRALMASRLLVWVAALGTIAVAGFGPVRHTFNPPGVTRGFGWLGDLLAAPAARWDAAWYLVIAHSGYASGAGSPVSSRAAFFPLYPLGLRAISELGPPPVLAGVILSVAALGAALYGIHRLTTLELGGRGPLAGARAADTARLAVLLMAFAPMAFFFSAVYSESLYLALSVGLFWAAREGRWALAGALGALAAATRSTGIVLIVPALMLYLYGPREDRAAEVRELARVGVRRLRPRYRLRADVLWLGLAPLGVALYMGYLSISGVDALSPFHAEQVWGRHFAGPYVGVWEGIRAGADGLLHVLGAGGHVYLPLGGNSPNVAASHNLILLVFLAAALGALIGVLRTLPLAYGAYVLIALALPLSYPVASQPLMSLPRFLVVLFPLAMWLAAWLARHPRAQRPALFASAALMACFAGQFATWHWVA